MNNSSWKIIVFALGEHTNHTCIKYLVAQTWWVILILDVSCTTSLSLSLSLRKPLKQGSWLDSGSPFESKVMMVNPAWLTAAILYKGVTFDKLHSPFKPPGGVSVWYSERLSVWISSSFLRQTRCNNYCKDLSECFFFQKSHLSASITEMGQWWRWLLARSHSNYK